MEEIKLSPIEGLSLEEVRRRTAAGEVNRVPGGDEKTAGMILRANIFTFFNLVNVTLAVILISVGSFRNIMFMGTVIANTLIATVQELRARETLKKQKLMNETPVKVMREGATSPLRPGELVLGDIICLSAGDQVPADCLVRKGTGSVNEALLTGESDSIFKREGDPLLSGSYIVSGSVTAQCVRVGAESYAARLTQEAKAEKRGKSRLHAEMNKLIKMISTVMLPVGIALFVRQHIITGMPLKEATVSAVGAMIGMIPNGLVLLISMALMVGLIRLGKRDTLVQELNGIEALARANVLCLDKTGTLTTGNMRVSAFVPVEAENEDALIRGFADYLAADDAMNATAAAIAAVAGRSERKIIGVMPFSSERKYSAVEFSDHETLIMGAVDRVWHQPLKESVSASIQECTRSGKRVIGLFRAEGPVSEDACPPAKVFLGFAVLSDELRPGAAETLKRFSSQGVDIRVISGDDPVTVSSVAVALGIEGAERYVNMAEIEDEAALKEAIENARVFGRVTPDKKRRLVKALREAGHSVAMIGDGVNDIPAMKEADCSIAMASGCDAARHAAMVTLLTGDLTALPAIVDEGRRVVNNVTRAASLFLVKTLYSLGLALIILFLPLRYPFQPIQLTLIAALTIGIPGIFLALEPNADPIRGQFLRKVLGKALPGAIGVMVAAIGAMAIRDIGITNDERSCVAAVCAALTGIAMLITVCRPLNRGRAMLIGAMTCILAAAVLFAGKLFCVPILELGSPQLIAIAVGGAVCVTITIVLSYLFGRNKDY